jgi:hypothetical protein
MVMVMVMMVMVMVVVMTPPFIKRAVQKFTFREILA